MLDAGAIGAGRRAEDARRCRRIVAGRAAGGGERIVVVGVGTRRNRPHRRVDERDLRREKIAEQPGDAPRHVDARPTDRGRRQHFDAGHAPGRVIPGRAAAHQGEALGDLFAAGAQGRAAPQIDDQRARHLAMRLQMAADHLVGGKPPELHRGRGRQHARVGGEEIAAGRQHVAPAARRRPGGAGRDAALRRARRAAQRARPQRSPAMAASVIFAAGARP